MKNTSFRRLWTKTSLKRIRKEFEMHGTIFLCNASKEFQSIWFTYKKEIQQLASEFNGYFPQVWSDVLFNDSLHRSWDEHRELRLEFLDYEIKRLSRPKHIPHGAVEKTDYVLSLGLIQRSRWFVLDGKVYSSNPLSIWNGTDWMGFCEFCQINQE